MPKLGKRSKKNLSEAHPLLQELFEEAIKHYDFSVIEGHRPKEEQDKAYHKGLSKLKYPQSKHNKQPSLAVDAVPYPIDWNDKQRFYYFGGLICGLAAAMGIDIRWGGDWDSDGEFKDQSFHDLPHFELRSTTRKPGIIPEKKEYLPDGPSDSDVDISLGEIEDSIFKED
jgi:hypothetical protein